MTEFKNYLDKEIGALQDAPSGASVAGLGDRLDLFKSAQTIPSNEEVAVVFNQEDVVVGTTFTHVAGVITVTAACIASVDALAEYQATTGDATARKTNIVTSGSFSEAGINQVPAVDGTNTYVPASITMVFQPGDTITVKVFHLHGGDLDVDVGVTVICLGHLPS